MSNLVKTLEDIRPKILEKIEGNKSIFNTAPYEVVINATDLNDLYYKTVLSALAYGRVNHIDTGSHAGTNRIEFDDAKLEVKYPTTRPLAPTSENGIPVPTSDDAIEVYYQNYLKNGFLEKNEHYRYSSWLRGMTEFAVTPHEIMLYETKLDGKLRILEELEKRDLIKSKEVERIQIGIESKIYLCEKGVPRGTQVDQVEDSIYEFTKKGHGTNHPCMRVGCAESMKRYRWKYDGETERGTSECLIHITPKIRENKLNFTCAFRSWDLIGGMPENLGGFTRLMEEMVEEINKRKSKSQPYITPGLLKANSDGLHIYEHHLEIAKLWARLDDINITNSW